MAQSLDGPWKRLDAPLFGPDPAAWDNVSFRYKYTGIYFDSSFLGLFSASHRTLRIADRRQQPFPDHPQRRLRDHALQRQGQDGAAYGVGDRAVSGANLQLRHIFVL